MLFLTGLYAISLLLLLPKIATSNAEQLQGRRGPDQQPRAAGVPLGRLPRESRRDVAKQDVENLGKALQPLGQQPDGKRMDLQLYYFSLTRRR
jgi:hypothetical protein